MVTKEEKELSALVARILLAAGADEQNARAVAEHLVLANLSGVDTHGIWHVGGYLKAVEAGEILPIAKPGIIKETPTSALISGRSPQTTR